MSASMSFCLSDLLSAKQGLSVLEFRVEVLGF